jgi:hypothetical protein
VANGVLDLLHVKIELVCCPRGGMRIEIEQFVNEPLGFVLFQQE